MTSIRQQVWEIPGTDPLVLALVGDDTTRLRGHPTLSPDTDLPVPPESPWAALKFGALQPAGIITSFVSQSDTFRAGEWEWWCYDDKQAGYGRLDELANAMIASYAQFFNTPDALTGSRPRLFDPDTGESVYGVKVGLPSQELADPLTDQRLIRVRWPYRVARARVWA